MKEYLARIGRKGGKASRGRLTVEQRIEAARKAAEARWSRQRKLVNEITEGTKQLLKTSKANSRATQARRAKQKKK